MRFRFNSLFHTAGSIREELRRTDPAGFVSRSGGTEGGSRKQPTDISEVRGQRLTESNPIKQQLPRPRRWAGAGSKSTRSPRRRATVMSEAVTVRENPPFICDRSSLGFLEIKERRLLSRYVIPDLSGAAFTYRRRKGHQRG